eukprot:PhF_6_TR21055/c2_g1_i1/m.30315
MKKSNQQPNVDSIRRTTRLGLTALDRANPINKIVAIPESRIIPTVGYRDYSKELRSICLHHHVGTCTLGDQCDQLHVDPEYIHRTRIPQHVTCCAAHGDAFTTEYASLLGRFKFFLRMPTTASSAHHETSSSSSSQHQLQELSVNHVALTESLLPSNADPGIPIEIDVHQICRNHLNGHCKFNKECRHIHVCRELYGRIRTRSTESMNIFLPQNTAAFHHQHQHQQHTYHHHQQHNHTIQVQPVSPLVPWTPPCITPFSYPPATSTAQPTLPNNNIQQQQQPFTMYVTQQQPHQPQAFTYVMMAPPPPPPPQPPSITSYTPEEVSVSKHLSPFQELCTVITLREVQLKQPTVVLDTVVRIPKDVFDNIQQKQRNPSRIHIALVEEKEIVPVSWPYSKEFSLFVSNQQVSDTSIPKPYCAKKGQLPKQCKLFQSLDITSYIKFPSVQIQLKNKPASMGKGFLLHPPCRVLIFAVRDLDAEVVTESCQRNLQRRPWTDTTTSGTCGDDLAVDRQIISLRCSFGHIPIVTPVRSAKCTHPQVIELVSFLVHVHRSRSWRCPVCDALCEEGLKSIIIDQGIVQYLEAARGRVPAKVVITASGDVENVPTPVSLTASDSFQSYPPEGAENDENDDDENDDIPPAKRVRTGSSSNGMLKTNSSASSSLRHNSANTAYRNTRDTALEID